MKHNAFETKIEKVTYVLEMIVAVLIAIGVAIGLIDLIKYFHQIFVTDPASSYELFNDFLGYALVLIVGIELILMIIYHSTDAILELVLFVIARKMLIYSHTMLDLVLGTLSLAIVFAIIKFLILKDEKVDIVKRGQQDLYSASTKMKDIMKKYDIPDSEANTLGGLVCSLADEACQPVEEGAEFDAGDIKIKVTKATEDGLIEEVKIIKREDEKNM